MILTQRACHARALDAAGRGDFDAAYENAARASSELRATGQPVAHDQRPDPVTLTPQQQEIAALAAAGLTNKQIGERLHLSHRTIATHLYQIFPKLGVTSRAALRDALSRSGDRKAADP